MKTSLKILFSSLIILILASCASLSEQGRKALDEGNYEKAMVLFQRALSNDKENADALRGLRQAQQIWIDRKLIDVRLLRLGKNIGESESLLLDILRNESLWRVFPSGVAFSTQAEEVALFAERILGRIDQYITQSNPLNAEFELRKNAFILETALSKNISVLKTKIYTSATQFCQAQLKSLKPNEFYTGLWVKQTCAIWKISIDLPQLKNSVSLFQDTRIHSSVEGLPPELSLDLDRNVLKAFSKSKWHDPKGKAVLDLYLKGTFTSNQTEKPVQREAPYFVEIPYEETTTRVIDPKRNSGISGVFSLLTLIAGTAPSERVTSNGDGTETVVTTKYRKEPRTHRYKATELKATKLLDARFRVALDSQSFSLDIHEKYGLLEDRHNENFPDAGLHPSTPEVLSDAEWIKVTGETLILTLSHELEKFWLKRFCESLSELTHPLTEREIVFRCAYQVSSTVPELLRQYYLKSWSMKYEDWREILR